MIDEVKHAYEVGVYPVDLFLLERTSKTLTEIDSMDVNRKMEYYYYIIEREKAEKRIMEDKMGSRGGSGQVNIPTNLPDSVTTKINKEIKLEELRKERRQNK